MHGSSFHPCLEHLAVWLKDRKKCVAAANEALSSVPPAILQTFCQSWMLFNSISWKHQCSCQQCSKPEIFVAETFWFRYHTESNLLFEFAWTACLFHMISSCSCFLMSNLGNYDSDVAYHILECQGTCRGMGHVNAIIVCWAWELMPHE